MLLSPTNARKLPDVDVSTIARAIPVVAFTEVAFTKDPPWLRRLAVSDTVQKVEGLWRRTVQVFTTSKAHVDSVCPIAKAAYVYYDDEVYDSVLTEKKTGITYVTQLVFDSETKVYYVYYRWGETDYKLNGPHETIESAKEALQITYKEKFDVEWTEREINTSERWVYEVKTYETFEEIKEVEEVIEESDAEIIIASEKETVVKDTKITEETTTTVTVEEVILEHVTKVDGVWKHTVQVVVEDDNDPFVLEKTRPLAGGKKGGSAELSTTAIAAVISASQM
ncbi:hypothetical protein BGZ75_006777 [Mortierella antarctica]|nr:hypothetical protein BGZ75_006777 [Mortierella antarctica]